ncbi:hypothetical protein MNBD_PLANCTO03-2467 [hydrothermal vent metagenome]|uniref:Uncharacterized protein n=1 Tax=hydrothermal vent metagenome TaxID=652676 RepID=A0A3B1E7Z6_9ZZZZ
MKSSHKIVLALVLTAVFVAAGGFAYYMHFYRQKVDLEAELATAQDGIERFQSWLEGRASAEDKLREIAATTLGFDAERVESRFRSGLNRMASSAGLVKDETVVTVRPITVVKNPAVEGRKVVAEFRRHQNDESISAPDLYTMGAQIRGSGSFESVTRLLALAQSQPWIWSVEGFTLKPKDNQATQFDVTVDVTTALLPDLAPKESGDEVAARVEAEPPDIVDPIAEQVVATAAIVERNVFAPPPPTPPDVVIADANQGTQAKPAKTPKAPPPPLPPYHEWRLTGLSGSPTQGRLAWMLNVRTGAAVLLRPGERVLDAVLVSAAGEEAVFQIGDGEFRLALNETLADRHPVE